VGDPETSVLQKIAVRDRARADRAGGLGIAFIVGISKVHMGDGATSNEGKKVTLASATGAFRAALVQVK
jgi:hypothetical protein